jgi:hypothetical protein
VSPGYGAGKSVQGPVWTTAKDIASTAKVIDSTMLKRPASTNGRGFDQSIGMRPPETDLAWKPSPWEARRRTLHPAVIARSPEVIGSFWWVVAAYDQH